ncbi:NADH-quinone oxidoreductase subunit K [Pyrobaculum aerophilum]|uniref:NADH-quinone oxidoreductase subunit K n=1 Tax=Pyrobaculum aerophilum TaxID=13773 RepID=UPI0023F2350A|nr:NADH-quinone oxidoreductase subunit K [Pyrobaculum aerophilum]MCX8136516.1 NADH-quinone oxidoreductase subunit K [Pyrobaculum aerophilum]
MSPAVIVGLLLIVLGIYSIAVTKNLVRILISLELVTVGAFAALAPAAASNPVLAFYGVLILVMVSVSEASILAALIYRNYALTKQTDVSSITAGREP